MKIEVLTERQYWKLFGGKRGFEKSLDEETRLIGIEIEKQKIKRKSQEKSQKAQKRGEIVRPNKCSKCGYKTDSIHGHHEDYNKPLEIIWLCPSCHSKRHQELK